LPAVLFAAAGRVVGLAGRLVGGEKSDVATWLRMSEEQADTSTAGANISVRMLSVPVRGIGELFGDAKGRVSTPFWGQTMAFSSMSSSTSGALVLPMM
jgi:hypothetical protein